MSHHTITREQADAVYTILVEECGAPNFQPWDSMSDRSAFLRYMADDDGFAKEWRFSGALGFGGKCRINSNHPIPYVDCYPEDETPKRRQMIERANARIAELFRSGGEEGNQDAQ